MPSVEDVILAHMLDPEYDPAKAHDYYLRTRKLKGRQLGSKVVTSTRTSHLKQLPKHVLVHPQSAQVKIITHQILTLQGALTEFRKALKALIEKEKAAQVKEKTTTKTKETAASDKKAVDQKPLTAKQKADAAERAKKSYEKNKKPAVLNRQELRAKIKEIEVKLQKLRADLERIKSHAQARPGTTGPLKDNRPVNPRGVK